MLNLRSTLTVLSLCACSTSGWAGVPPLESWQEIAPLRFGNPEWYCANRHTSGEWSVKSQGEQISVEKYSAPVDAELPFELSQRRFYGDRVAVKTENGWIVGFDGGEFSGGLWWFSSNGKRRTQLSESRIRAISPTTNGLVAIAGYSHMMSDHGELIELSAWRSHWRIVRSIDLGSAGNAVTKDSSGNLIIVANGGLLRYDGRDLSSLHDMDLGGLYPNSVVVDERGSVFVGMRHVIVKLTPGSHGFDEAWLVPPTCRALQLTAEPLSCRCIG